MNMISAAEAKTIIAENIIALSPVKLPLQEAAGKVLAEDVYATIDIPAFPQSSMDGYAFLFSEWNPQRAMQVEGEMPAGRGDMFLHHPGKAIRIFTGAAVPPGTDTVVMQEKVKLEPLAGSNTELMINDTTLRQGSNVRLKGSEIKAGELALTAGSRLSPAAAGFLAGIGIAMVDIFPLPSVTIIVTGNELQQPGKQLQYGQVYESNSLTLKAALEQRHIAGVKVVYAKDDLEQLKAVLSRALQETDIVLLTGGISAGDYDFVSQAATQCGVRQLFHKVKQRPGKPLYFGMKGSKPVFGLPGNPASVLTCFYEYVIPALEGLSNRESSTTRIKVPLTKPFHKPAGLTHFLKGFYDGHSASYLDAQESYRLRSFAKSNCLIQIDEQVTECKEGDMVEIHLLS